MRYLLLIISILVTNNVFSQQKHTLSGYIKDKSTGEVMEGAVIAFKGEKAYAVTNDYGFYSVTLEDKNYDLFIQYIGYETFQQKIQLEKDTRLSINLVPNDNVSEKGAEVIDKREAENVQTTEMGKISLDIKEIKKLPAFMGEVDLIKTIQLMPGVKAASEGSAGFYVRGGGPDQNLILLDGSTVYNAAHLFGFFSVFNADAVKGIEVYKGTMPANYGGRLASVLDITLKEGNNQEVKVDGGIGLIASRLTIQGPIQKNKSSFIISGRRTYIDVLSKPFVKSTSNLKGTGYYFYDLNLKTNFILSDKDRLFFSGYFGRDVFTYNNTKAALNIRIPWGNATVTSRWNHLFTDKLFMNTMVLFSDYQFESVFSQKYFDFKLYSGIRDVTGKVDFNWYPNTKHSVKYGVSYTMHRFIPSSASGRSGDVEFNKGRIDKLYANEGAIYITDDWDISPRLKITTGVRGSLFQHIGPFNRYIKDEAGRVVDTIVYTGKKPIKTYRNLEPRFAFRFKINEKASIKGSYIQAYQYLHLTSLSNVSLPTDIWVPSTDKVKPQFNTQYALGYFHNFKQNRYETSIEGYYKTLKNQIEFKNGTTFDQQVNDNIDNSLTFGKGRAYGVEFLIKKTEGKLNGWIGYTLSWTKRTFAALNNGLEYDARYDRRHDISIVANYQLTPKWTMAAIWVYSTGNKLTMPYARYVFEGNVVDLFGQVNNYRLPAYHRLDLSATYTKRKTKRYESSWNFSIYNTYSRLNPYFIYLDVNGSVADGTLKVQGKKVSIFPILPSVTYNFSF